MCSNCTHPLDSCSCTLDDLDSMDAARDMCSGCGTDLRFHAHAPNCEALEAVMT
jgi:RNase P subunit RPR2